MKYNMSDDFRGHEDMRVPLPEQGVDKILIPQLFIKRYAHPTGQFEREANGDFKRERVPHKNRKTGEITYTNEKIPITRLAWKISKVSDNKSINKTRQISSRKKKPVLDLKTAKVEKVQEEHHYIPRLADFPNLEDRRMIFEYLTHLHPDEENSFPENKTRGRPPILPANWDHHNLGPLPKNYIVKSSKVSHEDIFGSDTESESDEEPVIPFAKKQKIKTKKVIPLEPESESDEEEPVIPFAKKQKIKAKKVILPIQLEPESDSEEEEEKVAPSPEKPKPKSRGRQKKTEPVKEVEREENIAMKVVPPRHYPEIENLYKDFKLKKVYEVDNTKPSTRNSVQMGSDYIGKPNEMIIQKFKRALPYIFVNKFYLNIRKLPNQQLWGLTMTYTPDYHTEVKATLGFFPSNDKAKEEEKQLEQRFQKELKFEDTMSEFMKNAREKIKKAVAEKEQKGGAGGGPTGKGINPCWKGYEMIGMKKKKGKKVPNCIPKGEGIDFENIKWGTFKALYLRFLKNNPEFKDKIEDLEHFAHFVISNPEKFSKVAEKKARFYVNLIEKK
jgi:hypothetical protein